MKNLTIAVFKLNLNIKDVSIIKIIFYQLKKRPLLTGTLMFVITFVMIFLSVTYSSMSYNDKVFKIINNRHASKDVISYTLCSKGQDKEFNKETLKNIGKDCDIEVEFYPSIDSVKCTTKIIYLNNKKPQIILYDKRAIKEGEFNKAYLGKNLAEEYKGKISILGKEYPIGETVGIKGETTKLDSTINIYVNNIEDLYDIFLKGDNSGGAWIDLYKNNKNYSSYDKDMNNVFNEERYYIKNITRKENGVKKLKFGFEYVSLILIGLISTISISTFWITDRKKDIGIKMALGAKKKDIIHDVYKELLTICIFCGIISFIVTYIISKNANNISAIRISINMQDFLWFAVSVILISTIVAIIPIHKATNTDIVDSIKGR